MSVDATIHRPVSSRNTIFVQRGLMKKALTILVFVGVLAAACSSSGKVSADDYGAAWPLTVDKAVLHCIGDGQVAVVWMSAGAQFYPLTGFSKTYLNKHHPNLILRDLSQVHISGRSVSPLIRQAQELCG